MDSTMTEVSSLESPPKPSRKRSMSANMVSPIPPRKMKCLSCDDMFQNLFDHFLMEVLPICHQAPTDSNQETGNYIENYIAMITNSRT